MRSRTRQLPEPWRFDAIGTAWTIETAATELSGSDRAAVTELIARADRTWSRFRDDGAVARLRAGEEVDLGEGAAGLFDLYDELHRLTSGAVSPLVGASLEALGYDAEYTLRQRSSAVPAPAWPSVQRDGDRLRLPPGTVLDVGAAGKGWIVDRVADLLASRGHQPVVDAGGDIAHRGAGTLRIALEHPGDRSLAVGVAELASGMALCGSAVNRRAWGRGLHHVLDARTGRPTPVESGVVATWVIAPTAAVADGAATALFFSSPERLDTLSITAAAWIDANGLHATANFPGELFS